MNDAPDAIKQIFIYADDTILQASDADLAVLAQTLNEDLESLSKRLNENTQDSLYDSEYIPT